MIDLITAFLLGWIIGINVMIYLNRPSQRVELA